LLGDVAFSGFESTFSLLLDQSFRTRRHGVVYALFTAIGLAMVVMQARVVGQSASASAAVRSCASRSLQRHRLRVVGLDGRWVSLGVGAGIPRRRPRAVHADAVVGDARGVDPASRGEAFGVQQSASALGRIAGPVLAGMLFEHVGVASPYIARRGAGAMVAWVLRSPRCRGNRRPVALLPIR
jgi:hypothetical protein